MADAMTSMAQMCQTMMQREDRSLRYLVVVSTTFDVVVMIALVLFIILEMQWIRVLNLRIRTERRSLMEDGAKSG